MLKKVLLVVLCVIFFGTSAAFAARPYTGKLTFNYKQPDGSSFPVKLMGSDFFAYEYTPNGRNIVRGKDGWWYFATARMTAGDERVTKAAATLAVDSTGKSSASPTERIQKGNKPVVQVKAAVSGPRYTYPKEYVQEQIKKRQAELGLDHKGRHKKHDGVTTKLSARQRGGPFAPPTTTTTGTKKALVVIVEFADTTTDLDASDIDAFMNADTITNGVNSQFTGVSSSVRDYFLIQSNGALDYTSFVFPTKVVLGENKEDYGTLGIQAFYDDLRAALNSAGVGAWADGKVDLEGGSDIAYSNFVLAGASPSEWAAPLWAHQSDMRLASSNGSAIDNSLNIGKYQISHTIAAGSSLGKEMDAFAFQTYIHETGHLLCDFPDLYEYTESVLQRHGSSLVGEFSLMAYGGYKSVNIDPYLRFQAGWLTPVRVNSSNTVLSLKPLDADSGTTDDGSALIYYKNNDSGSQEYLLFERRAPSGAEGPTLGNRDDLSAPFAHPGNGVVVYHVHEGGSNTYPTMRSSNYFVPYELLLVEANPADFNNPITNLPPWYNNPLPDLDDVFLESDDIIKQDTPLWYSPEGRTIKDYFTATVVLHNDTESRVQFGTQTTTKINVNHGGGVITSSPEGLHCSSLAAGYTECGRAFLQGAGVSLSASPGDGQRFSGWSGDCSGTSCSLQAGGQSVTANFNSCSITGLSLIGVDNGSNQGTAAAERDGSTLKIRVNGDENCGWIVQDVDITPNDGYDIAPWLQYEKRYGVTGEEVTITVERNTTSTLREAKLKIGGLDFTITQPGGSPASCFLARTDSYNFLDFWEEGQEGEVFLEEYTGSFGPETTSGQCYWEVNLSSSWIVPTDATGNPNGKISGIAPDEIFHFKIGPNYDNTRTGAITLNNQVNWVIEQEGLLNTETPFPSDLEGGPGSGCSLSDSCTETDMGLMTLLVLLGALFTALRWKERQ